MKEGYSFTKNLFRVSEKELPTIGEKFDRVAEGFDANEDTNSLFLPMELTRFYDSQIFNELDHSQQVKLNRLTWCQMYQTVAFTESAACILNSHAAHHKLVRNDLDVAFYMARETIEEYHHIKTFLIIIKKTVEAYGIDYADFTAANRSGLAAPVAYYTSNSILAYLLRRFELYYFSRFALNISLKSVERTIAADADLHPTLRDLMINHRIDEARHQTMSNQAGRLGIDEIKSSVLRSLACRVYVKWVKEVGFGVCGPPRKKLIDRNRTAYTSMLEWCGVAPEKAREAYSEWVRGQQMNDMTKEVRSFYLGQNHSLLKKLQLSSRARGKIENRFANLQSAFGVA